MELFLYSLTLELFPYIKVLFLKSSWPYSFVFLPPSTPTSSNLILRNNCNSLTIVQVHVPVDDVDHDVGGGEDDPGDCVYLGDRVQSFLRVIHSLGNTPGTLLVTWHLLCHQSYLLQVQSSLFSVSELTCLSRVKMVGMVSREGRRSKKEIFPALNPFPFLAVSIVNNLNKLSWECHTWRYKLS